MKTAGEIIKEARVKKKYSRARLESETKIKKEFIEALEQEDWARLPEYPVVSGFVKNIADALSLDRSRITAVLRRDYPPKPLDVNPRPDVTNKFIWSPRLTFILGVFIVIVVILGYLSLQYSRFVRPPDLEVFKPTDGQVVSDKKVIVSGKTNPDATVKINNQPILISEEGDFEAEIEISANTQEIEIHSVSRSGKGTVIRRKIKPEISDL